MCVCITEKNLSIYNKRIILSRRGEVEMSTLFSFTSVIIQIVSSSISSTNSMKE